MQEAAKELAQAPERAVDVLLNEVLETVEQQFVLVLDDYHHLGAETPVHRVVDRLLAYLPDLMHVVIISRDVPPLALSRLRTQASLSVIDRAELLFTDDETRELFRNVFDLELTPEQLAEYRERTHGWITALQLVRQVAQRQAIARGGDERRPPRPTSSKSCASPSATSSTTSPKRSSPTRPRTCGSFLLRVSLLERVEPETCSHLYPEAHNAALLQTLVRRNVFISLAADARGEEYRLHPLFRSFLQRRFRAEAGRQRVAAEHARIAAHFLAREQWEQAMRHLLAAEDFDRAAATIAEHGGAWISAGALASLAAFADALPRPALEAHPRALVHRAEVARLRDEFDAGAGALPPRGRAPAASRATARARPRCSTRSRPSRAAAATTRRPSPTSTAPSSCAARTRSCARSAATRAACASWRTGQWTEAEREFRVALAVGGGARRRILRAPHRAQPRHARR